MRQKKWPANSSNWWLNIQTEILINSIGSELTIYAPMIYMAPCIIFLMWADTLRGQVGGGGPSRILTVKCQPYLTTLLAYGRHGNSIVSLKNSHLQTEYLIADAILNPHFIGSFLSSVAWNSLKISALLPLIKIYQMRPLPARSISLYGTFNVANNVLGAPWDD